MKVLFTVLVSALVLTAQKCGRKAETTVGNCLKGRLEVKGICGNYTIALLEGSLDKARLSATWKDETTGKTYTNIFALGSPCNFPEKLNAGDEFYFTLNDERESCNVCMAYYPTPPKKLSIKVVDGPCR